MPYNLLLWVVWLSSFLKKHKKYTVFIQLWRLFSNFVPVNEHDIV